MKERYLQNLQIALEAIKANKLRSLLTALGIIFGVAAVIAMLAIGNGAKEEILEQMKLVGVNNIVITPLTEQSEDEVTEEDKPTEKKKFSPGITLRDLQSIQDILPSVEKASPEILIETDFVYAGLRRSGKLVGVEPVYFEITNFKVDRGSMFNDQQMKYGAQVCIIGKGVQTKFFSKEDPIGKYIKCGPIWLQIIGVLEERTISESAIGKLGIRDYNMDIYTPLKTMLIRYKNRSLVTKASLMAGSMQEDGEESESKKQENYHQIDRLVVQVKETELLQSSAEVISRLMERKHYGVIDYEITIPIVLLEQQQRTKDLLNMVLLAIASISLLVGGIGIMNIMLASVMERIKEIGIRLSIGATKKDIVMQFVIEAVLISLTGGFAGVVLGLMLSVAIGQFLDIKTIISGWSIVISFGVSALTGLVFGITPAKRAAEQDPIKSLRHE